MSDHDFTDMQAQRFISAPLSSSSAGSVARAAQAGPEGTTCRLGDASCAAAHAGGVSRSALGNGAMLHRSLRRLQRDYGNQFVGHVLRQVTGGNAERGMEAVERSIDAARGGGHGMDHSTRTRMESAFGADFSGVRIHHDSRADGLSQSLSARAFATGRDVFFRQGEYSPGTSSGRELLAHELTHVVQQNGPGVQRKMSLSQPGDPHEVEADQMARAVIQQEHSHSTDPQVVARQQDEDKQVATKSDVLQRQPEAPKLHDEEEKKLHAKLESGVVSRQEDEEAPGE